MGEFHRVISSRKEHQTYEALEVLFLRLFKEFDGDSGMAVIAAALGSAVNTISTMFESQVGLCPEHRAEALNARAIMIETIIKNFEHTANNRDEQEAKDLVKDFFERRKKE